MMRCRDFVAFRYAVLLFVDSVNVWLGDVEILRLCDLTLLWFVDLDILRRSEFVTLGLHISVFLRPGIFPIREIVISRNSMSAISRVCFFQNLFFVNVRTVILATFRFCDFCVFAIWKCKRGVYGYANPFCMTKRIVIVKWNRPINVGRVAWTRKLHSPRSLLLELWQPC